MEPNDGISALVRGRESHHLRTWPEGTIVDPGRRSSPDTARALVLTCGL